MKKLLFLFIIFFGFIILSNESFAFENENGNFQVLKEDTIRSYGVTLYPCYPNPATKTSTIKIKFMLEEESAVKIKIYDSEGNETKSVINDVVYSEGTQHTETVEIDDLYVGSYNVALIVKGKLISRQFVVMK